MLLDPIPSPRKIRIAPAIGRQLYLNLSQFENVDERTKDSNFGPGVLFVAAVDGGQPVEWDRAGYFWIASRFFLPGPLDCANVGAKVVLRDRTQVQQVPYHEIFHQVPNLPHKLYQPLPRLSPSAIAKWLRVVVVGHRFASALTPVTQRHLLLIGQVAA